jgi:uncharacterized protein YndB with AHSA1/START domain
MNLLKRLLKALLVLVVVFCAGGFLLPATTRVEREITIARPPADVFAMVDSFRRFNEWSPWHGRDPKTVYTYEGPERGVGASMRWSSEQSDVGKGRQTILESMPDQRVRIRLEFEGQGDAIATIALTPAGDGTRVVWDFEAAHGMNPVSRWFGLLFDRMIGPDYEQGLAQLKTALERPSQ